MADPLILTAAFDPASRRLFQDLRDRHFPARLNIVPAHVSLFHQLPGPEVEAVEAALAAETAAGAPLRFATGELRFLGRGVAIAFTCPGLVSVRQVLATRWAGWLTAQDRQTFKPHVTIQNKVTPAEARLTFERLAGSLDGLDGTIVGLDLWWYRGGPWEPAGKVRWSHDAG